MAEHTLTPKQQRFVEEYLANGRNAAAAYRTAYASKGSAQRIADEAWKLLQHPGIAQIVGNALEQGHQAVVKAMERYQIDQEGLLRRLALLADYDHRDIFDWTENGVRLKPSAVITKEASFAITEIREGKEGLTVKLADKRAALMDIAKLRGWVTDRSQQLGADGKPIDPRQTFILKVER